MADDSSAENETGIDLTKLKVPDLKKLLKSRGLSTTGNKCDLIERLQNAAHDMSGDDLLEESAAGDSETYDELEELDESALMGDEKDEESKEKTEDEECDESDGPPEKKKRVVIDRSASKEPPKDLKKKGVEEDVEDEEEGEGLEVDEMDEEEVLREEEAPAAPAVPQAKAAVPEAKAASTAVVSSTGPAEVTQAQPPTNGEAPKRIVKIKELSTKEKLELRAQKFGLTESAKKEIRAQRFGKVQGIETDILKKRAERFGIVSPEVSKTDLVQKKEARKERFQGTSTVTTAPTVSKHKLITGPDSSTTTVKGDQFKKLAARKERFQGGAAPTPKPVAGPDSSSTAEKKVLPSQRVKITAT